MPKQGIPGFVITIIAGLCAICLFLLLNGQRARPEQNGPLDDIEIGSTAPTPPPLVIPPEIPRSPILTSPLATAVPQYPIVRQPAVQLQRSFPVLVAPHEPVRDTEPMPYIVPNAPTMPYVAATPPQTATLTEPAIVFDVGAGEIAGAAPPQSSSIAGAETKGSDLGPGGRSSVPAHLEQLQDLSITVPTGTIIRATLETPIDTSRPGMARAVVSKDVRGFNGGRILIPRGSRLVGEYSSDVRSGQNRVLLNWTQLLRPDGSMIRLESPAADAMGGAGVPGQVHSFFFQRFINAVLQTAMNVGGSFAAYSYRSPVIVGVPNAAVTNVVSQTGGGLIGQGPQPKITVKQGAVINIFVARDLDFSYVADRTKSDGDGR